MKKDRKISQFRSNPYVFLPSLLAVLVFCQNLQAQEVPSREENIPFLVTFSTDANKAWGDDDFCQVFFFTVPKTHSGAFYIRVFDPDCGGQHDEQKSTFNSKTKFTIYGGEGCITDKDARGVDPKGNYKSGNLLATKTFSTDPTSDNQWYTFGPFDPGSGELAEKFGGYVFKVIANGQEGDDGNLYKYFLSTEKDSNKAIEGGNAFTFEYTFRLHTSHLQISHIYPFVDDKVISVKQSNFDWDSDGHIRVISKGRKGDILVASGDNVWGSSSLKAKEEEKNSSMDIQFIKSEKDLTNNNVVFYMTNQYGEYLPFYSLPIGGVPKYKYSIGIKSK